jgi:hypothetical protein
MFRLSLKVAIGAAVVAVMLAAIPHAQVRPSTRDIQAFKQKLATIIGPRARSGTQSRRITVSESELNAFLAYEAQPHLPAGVIEPSVSITGPGQVAGRAVVDLNALRQTKNATGMLDPRSYLTGQVPVTASGVLTTNNGVGRFELESATVGGIPVPKIILQEIISQYSRTPEYPSGISLDDSFPLPARIREIQVQRGQATIVQ